MDTEKVIDKIQEIIRRLEVVFKSSSNPRQRKRVSMQKTEMKKDLKKIEDGNFTEEDAEIFI